MMVSNRVISLAPFHVVENTKASSLDDDQVSIPGAFDKRNDLLCLLTRQSTIRDKSGRFMKGYRKLTSRMAKKCAMNP